MIPNTCTSWLVGPKVNVPRDGWQSPGLSPTSVDEKKFKKFKKKFWQFAGISGWEEGNIHVGHLITNTYGGTMRNQGNLVLFGFLFFYYFIKIN